MNSCPRFWAVLAVAAVAGGLHAAEAALLHGLIGPVSAVAPGATAEVQLVVLNRSAAEATVVLPDALRGSVTAAGGRWAVELRSGDHAGAPRQSIPAGGFLVRTYAAVIPGAAFAGTATLEASIPGGGVAKAALEIGVASEVAAATQRPTTNLVQAQAAAAAALRRTFADRIGAHEPLYFIYGADEPGAKFQFSFKYKLFDFRALATQRMVRTLQFAFTQRSLWDLDGVSSPFYDTSYMPELIYESLAPQSPASDSWFTWLGFQAAYKHESNGRDGPLSRSVNSVYARPVFAFGPLSGWHLLAIPEASTYVDSLEDNPNLKSYRGYGKLNLVFGRNDGPSLMATIWGGKDFDHGSVQLDLTLPIRTRLLNFETYLLVQYFNGYGESLLSYAVKSETVRGGFSLVR